MKKQPQSMRSVGLFLFATLIGLLFFAKNQKKDDQLIYSLDLASESSALPYGSLDLAKKRFVQENAKVTQEKSFNGESLIQTLQQYNQTLAAQAKDPIDAFLSLLPKSYRQHFTLVHRSFSIQKASPLSPRVIMYGTDAKVMMTFNGAVDENGKAQDGGQTIEVIEWLPEKKIWEFSEISFSSEKKAHIAKNPPKCVMCHAGTPKPVDYTDIGKYQGLLKPIFPQYPFWPGFYGSVNDVVGIDEPKSKDTISRHLPDTIKQVKDLTFDSTEELYRLRELMDKPNSKYLKVVENELNVHLKYFRPFMDSIKKRERYRHLALVTDSYTQKNEKIPEALRSAPYRRTFDKEYGHYMLRPNFYLTSLLAAYQAQYIAEQISQSPVFAKIKYSLLYKKFNCGEVTSNGISTFELNPSFDLLYPNQSSEESRNKQYLLAYQYNVVQSQKSGVPHLPLHAWNLEGNEDIASYHYGNVYADLNELVLWNLISKVFPDVTIESGRDAAEKRHYELSGSNYFQQPLNLAKSYVSRMTQDQMNKVSSYQAYADTQKKFKAMPVSVYCSGMPVYDNNKKLIGYKNSLKEAVEKELIELANAKQNQQLPHQIYALDKRFYKEDEISRTIQYNVHLVRQACEACHKTDSNDSMKKINPAINVNWSSASYWNDLRQTYESVDPYKTQARDLYSHIKDVISADELPIPYGQQMPFGRKAMDSLSLQCENYIVDKQNSAQKTLSYVEIFECGKSYPQADKTSLACRCFDLINTKHKVYLEMYKNTTTK